MGYPKRDLSRRSGLSAKTLAALCASASENLTTINRCHAGTETVAAFADEARWLECTFHGGTLLFFVFLMNSVGVLTLKSASVNFSCDLNQAPP
jgi:hypothetical protein